jgi:protein-disulfide isomerase
MARTLLAFALVVASFAPAAAQQGESCECEVQRPTVLAVVDGVEIPTAGVEADAEPYVAPIKQQMQKLRESALQTLITNRLIELEAAKRGVTVTSFYQTEIVGKADEPTADEVRVFYERNRAGMDGKSFEEVREQLTQYIRSQRQQVQMTILTTDLRTSAKIEVHDYSPQPPATPEDRAKVLATVNESKITLGELEDSLRAPMYTLRRQVWEIERQALDNRIDDALVEREAQRRGVTLQALADAEIIPKAKKVDAFDASKFYNENKNQFGGRPFAEVKDDLVRLLNIREQLQAKMTFAAGLRKTATIKDNLVEPQPPTFVVAAEGRPALGAASAPVTIVVFSDFECPKCALAHDLLAELAREYAGKVRVVARNYPLEQHQNAYKAALAAEAALEQGKYWEYAKLLFANQTSLSVEKLKELATQAGLDRARFDEALDSAKHAGAVDRDMADGGRAGVLGTPAVYVNGRAVDDDSKEGLKAAIEAALKPRG